MSPLPAATTVWRLIQSFIRPLATIANSELSQRAATIGYHQSVRCAHERAKLNSIAAAAFTLLSTYSSKRTALCNGNNESGKDDKDDYVFEVDEDCPFCRFFLESPCRSAFIDWHACVKRSDKPTDCIEEFRPLNACMDDNGMGMNGKEVDEGNEDDQ